MKSTSVWTRSTLGSCLWRFPLRTRFLSLVSIILGIRFCSQSIVSRIIIIIFGRRLWSFGNIIIWWGSSKFLRFLIVALQISAQWLGRHIKTIHLIRISPTTHLHILHLRMSLQILLIINIINIRMLSMVVIYPINIFSVVLIFIRRRSSLLTIKTFCYPPNIALFRFIGGAWKTREPASTRLLLLNLILL